MVIIFESGDDNILPPLIADQANKALGVSELPVNGRVVLSQVSIPGAAIFIFCGFTKFPVTSVLSLAIHPLALVAVR